MDVLEARANPLDTGHSEYGSQDPGEIPYFGTAYDGGYSAEYGSGGDFEAYYSGGMADDGTPTTHSSPYPKGIIQYDHSDPNALAMAGQQIMRLHGKDLGGVEFYTATATGGHEEPAHYTTDRYDAPNENNLSGASEQIKSAGFPGGKGGSAGNADVTQGYGKLNGLLEFQGGHSIRRVQHDTMHFDYTNTHGEQDSPFYGRHPISQAQFNGPDSPYFASGNIDGANIPWEGRIGDPSPYVQPAEVTIAPAMASSPDLFAW
jgi:hypothetical protein